MDTGCPVRKDNYYLGLFGTPTAGTEFEMHQEHTIAKTPQDHDIIRCLQSISICAKSTLAPCLCGSRRMSHSKKKKGVQIAQIRMRSIAWHTSGRTIKIIPPPRT